MQRVMGQGVFGLQLDVQAMGVAVSACRAHWQPALALLRQGQHLALISDVAVNTGIACCSYGRSWAQAMQLLRQHVGLLRADQLTTALNTVAKAFEHRLRWDLVLSVHSVMVAGQSALDAISCSTAVSACGKSQRWELSLGVWKDCKSRTVEPNVIAYGAACSACSEHSLVSALALLDEMQQGRLQRNLITCNIELASYAGRSLWQSAWSLLESMDKLGPAPNLVSLREAAFAKQSRPLLARLQSSVPQLLASCQPVRASFSSFLPVTAAVEAIELLDGHGFISEFMLGALSRRIPPQLILQLDGGDGGCSLFGLGRVLTQGILTLGSARWDLQARRQAHLSLRCVTRGAPRAPEAQMLLAWRAASLQTEASGFVCAGAVVPYGPGPQGPEDKALMSLPVEHDRSLHAERRALLALLWQLKGGTSFGMANFHTSDSQIAAEVGRCWVPPLWSFSH